MSGPIGKAENTKITSKTLQEAFDNDTFEEFMSFWLQLAMKKAFHCYHA
jgi:hypothetical protein